MASSQTQFVSREEYKAKKALEEARKQGTAPAQVDEEGKEINPHMPQYITQAPWYLNQNLPSLKHQRARAEALKTSITDWYPRGVQSSVVATKFRKGACENCGSMTHKKKECFEKPRTIGAKYTGKNFQPDDIYHEIDLDYDAKRDRWNGYDPDSYSEVIKEFEVYNSERKLKKQQELDDEALIKKTEDEDDEEYKLKDFENSAPVPNQDPKIRTTTRNLRIREDVAKYLLNLDVGSAYYDPKSRSMRENPNPYNEKLSFKGENVTKFTGQALDMLNQEMFVWDTVEKKNAELNTLGMPTGTEMLYKNLKQKQEQQSKDKNKALVDRYGGTEHENPDIEMLLSQTERYHEFTRDGKVINNNSAKTTKRSKYEEDVMINNHTTTWGSHWNEELGWGFACCHSNQKQSMCWGEKGKKNAVIREYKIKKMKLEEIKKAEELATDDNQKTETKELAEAIKTLERKVSNNQDLEKQLKKEESEISESKEKEKKKDSSSSSDSSSDSDSDSSSDSSSVSSGSLKRKRKGNKKKEKKEKKKKVDKKKTEKKRRVDSDSDSENMNDLDKKKLKKALKKEEEEKKMSKINADDRKRGYNSAKGNNTISKEDIEAYRLKKSKHEDPMNQMNLG